MERLYYIVDEVLENSDLERVKDLDHNTVLVDDLGMDSFALAELTVRIEDEYGIDIFEDGIVRTIGEIAQKISGAKNE